MSEEKGIEFATGKDSNMYQRKRNKSVYSEMAQYVPKKKVKSLS